MSKNKHAEKSNNTRGEIHVTKREDGRWQGQQPGTDRASFVADTKRDAMDRARVIAQHQGLELVPHNQDGRIANPNSYGNDPTPPHDART
jgi:uncharacterized protein YdaT